MSDTQTLQLTSSDFDQNDFSLKNPNAKRRTVIIFYAPWCGHCQHFKPIYEKVAQMANQGELGNDVTVATVNGDDEKTILELLRNSGNAEFKVSGFPTVVSYWNGKYYSNYAPDSDPQKRQAYRTKDDLIEYIQGIGSSPVQYVQQ
jgi:thiol-disulfide isomerase/thioredoxin